jgi:very-short-patch-repair endonuclease
VDFADPIKKIAIEVDGKWHHTMEQIEKDNKRQQEVEDLGWRVIRIDGRQTYKERQDYLPEDVEVECEGKFDLSDYYHNCSEGILLNLKNLNYYETIKSF